MDYALKTLLGSKTEATATIRPTHTRAANQPALPTATPMPAAAQSTSGAAQPTIQVQAETQVVEGKLNNPAAIHTDLNATLAMNDRPARQPFPATLWIGGLIVLVILGSFGFWLKLRNSSN